VIAAARTDRPAAPGAALVHLLPHGWLHRLHERRLGMSAAQFDAVNFAGLVLSKVGVLLLNVVPCVALDLVA
jgi:hypothetical protein